MSPFERDLQGGIYMITGIEHVAICARNTTTLKDWYIKTFDFKQVFDNGKGTYFLKAPNGAMIEFISLLKDTGFFEEKDSGIRHLALAVDNFEEMVDKLTVENVDVLSAPVVLATGVKVFFFRDPEGNILHLISRPEPL
jgi:glyoxylase I family protein